VKEVRRDFDYFRVPRKEVQARVELYDARPNYDGLPALPASVTTPRNICFRNERVTYVDYFNRALAVLDRQEASYRVTGTDHDLLREIAYLYILSAVGQYLDSRRIHRVHALGVSYGGRGVLLLLPSGGGKSTMAWELLRQPGFLLLSEDTPLIDRCGRILPFPLPLGVRPGSEIVLPQAHVRTVSRMEFGPKTLIDIDYFRDRLGEAVEPGWIMVGERNLGEVSEIVPMARPSAFGAVVKYMVVGLGVYQGLEFLLERGLRDLLGKSGVGASRLYNGLRLLSRAPTYRFVLGQNPARNCQTLVEFLRRTGG
jgi:hypothetical protein